MKELEFNLKLKFSEKVRTDDEIETIMHNILKSIEHACNTIGIVDDCAEYFTEEIIIQNNFLNTTFNVNLKS